MIKKWIGVVVAISVVLALVVLMGGTGCAKPAEEATYDWKISQPYPSGMMLYDLVEDFMGRVADTSDGRITITHYPGDLLGDYSVQQESVAAGTHEMCYTWPLTSLNPKWDAMWLGYIMYNWEQGIEAVKSGGWLLSIFDPIAEETNWKIIGVVPTGETNVQSKQLYDPLNPEGRKVRIQPTSSWVARFEALGYSPVTMPMSEVATGLATGAIDAAAGFAQQEMRVYGDCFTYVYCYHDMYTGTMGVMNLDTWNSLSAEDQEIVQKAMARSIDAVEGRFGDLVAKDWNDLLDWQIVVSLDGDAWSTCAEKARAAEWTAAEEWIGKDLVDVIREHAEPLPWGLTIDEMDYGFGVLTSDWIIARQGEVITGP